MGGSLVRVGGSSEREGWCPGGGGGATCFGNGSLRRY